MSLGKGSFSALSYAQLTQQLDAWYVILNSVENRRQWAARLDEFTAAGMTEVILALDRDEAGYRATVDLAQACYQAGLHSTLALPPKAGEDWNDVLRHRASVAPWGAPRR